MTTTNSDSALTRVGIVGCGLIASNHIRALQQVKGVHLVAVCDRNDQLAHSLAARHRVAAVHTDMATMLAKEQLDTVHVTTPPRTHAEICGFALQAGCHVLVEKPVALTVAELNEMLRLAHAGAVTLSAVHNCLFLGAFRRAQRALQSGAVGEIRSVHITDHIPWDYANVANEAHWSHSLPGGVFGEMLPHDVYLADTLVPELGLDCVTTLGPGRYPWLPREQLQVSMRAGSALVTLHLSVGGSAWNKTIDITGPHGTLRADLVSGVVTTIHPAPNFTRRPHIERVTCHIGNWIGQTASVTASRLLRRPVSGHDGLIRGFYSALSSGGTPPVSEEELLRTTTLYETITTAVDNRTAAG